MSILTAREICQLHSRLFFPLEDPDGQLEIVESKLVVISEARASEEICTSCSAEDVLMSASCLLKYLMCISMERC